MMSEIIIPVLFHGSRIPVIINTFFLYYPFIINNRFILQIYFPDNQDKKSAAKSNH